MRYLAPFLLSCLLALPAVARSGGGSHGSGGGVHGGGFHSGAGGGFRGGYGGVRYGGFRYGAYGRNRFYVRAGYAYWPWAYWSPFYDYGYPYDSYPDSYYDNGDQPRIVTYPPDYPPEPAYAPPPPVRPVMREYLDTPPSQDDERPIYLIAFKGQDNIRAAEAYWIEGNTLHYVNLQHEQKQTPLDSIDRAFSERLNRGRRVAFRLPPTS